MSMENILEGLAQKLGRAEVQNTILGESLSEEKATNARLSEEISKLDVQNRTLSEELEALRGIPVDENGGEEDFPAPEDHRDFSLDEDSSLTEETEE